MGVRQLSKVLAADGRAISLHLTLLKNGSILLISEGEEVRLGSLAMSIGIGRNVETSLLTPAKFSEVLLRYLAEDLARSIGGMSLVSFSIKGEVPPDLAKRLVVGVRDLVREASLT